MAVNWLPPVSLTASGLPVLLPGEVEHHLVPAVDLEPEENDELPPLRSGLLRLTSHRILWIDERAPRDGGGRGFSIPLAVVVKSFFRKNPLWNMFSSPRIGIQVKTTPDGRVAESGTARSDLLVMVVLRGKADPEAFHSRLLEVLSARAWEAAATATASASASASTSGSAEYAGDGNDPAGESAPVAVRMPVIGVSGILRKEQEQWESTDKSLQDAFRDLNALMSKAQEMVKLADKLRQKLLSSPSSQGNGNDEDMGSKQEMQDWLLRVGIASPVTKESAGALYHQQLSRELADFVKSPLEKEGGMISLLDVYCLYNRARGTELISPDDLLQACALWEIFDATLMLRKFDSGVMVIQNKAQRDEEVFARIESLARKPHALRVGISPRDAAFELRIAPALAKEHLLNAESKGRLCRDISPDGFRFYINLFKEMDPSNIYACRTDGIFQSWLSATSFSG